MSFSTVIVGSSNRILHPTISTLFLLSTFSNTFDVTIQDIYGRGTPFIVSTMNNVYLTARNISSFFFSSPYSFLTLRNLSTNVWLPLNSFNLPSTQAAHQLSSFVTSSLTTSNMEFFTTSVSSFTPSMIRAKTVTVQGNTIAPSIFTISSNFSIASTLTTSSIFTSSILIQGNTSTQQNLVMGNRLNAFAAAISGNVVVQSSAIFGPTSTQSFFTQGAAVLNSTTTAGIFDVRGRIFLQGVTTSSLEVASTTNFRGSVLVSSLTASSFSLNSTLTVGQQTSAGQLTTQTLTTTGIASFFRTLSVSANLSTIHTLQTSSLQTSFVSVGTISSCSTLVTFSNMVTRSSILGNLSSQTARFSTTAFTSTLTNVNFPSIQPVNIVGSIGGSTLLKNRSTIRYRSDELSILNLSNLYLSDTLNVKSQTAGFNDIVGMLNSFVGKTSTGQYFNANGLSPAVSFTGQYMFAVGDNSTILFSSNTGDTFSVATSTLILGSVTDSQISGNGQYSAVAFGSSNFTWSQNSGTSWITKVITTVSPSRTLTSGEAIGFSHDASIQLLAGKTTPAPSQNNLIISSNFGNTWTSVFTYPSVTPVRWNSVAVSSNAQVQVVVGSNTPILFSSNAGAIGSWSTRLASTLNWTGVAVSSNGQYITAAASNNFIYISSNFGSNWIQRDSFRNWGKVSMTASGQFQAIAANLPDQFFYSYDYGNTWSPRLVASANIVRGVALSKTPGFQILVTPGFGRLTLGFANFNFRCSVNIDGNLQVASTISKAAGAFEIPHPLLSQTKLVHSFIEGPRCDLLYRGKASFEGSSTLTIDLNTQATANNSQMHAGTFERLTKNPQIFLKNNSSPNRVKGSLQGSLLRITANSNTFDTVDWMVVAERTDPAIKAWKRTDRNGCLLLEHAL